MYINGLSSCDVQEICALRQSPSALEAMKTFCRLTLGGDPKGRRRDYSFRYEEGNGQWTDGLGEIYIFHGPVAYKRGSKPGAIYGQFKAFILEHKLGTVAEGEVGEYNARYHPDTKSQAFIWTVDKAALKKWWQAERQPGEKKESAVVLEEGAAK